MIGRRKHLARALPSLLAPTAPLLPMLPSPPVARLLSQLKQVKPAGDGKWTALCPAHDDHDRSLSIKEGRDGRALAKCFAGCAFPDIIAAAGLLVADTFADERGSSGSSMNGAALPFRPRVSAPGLPVPTGPVSTQATAPKLERSERLRTWPVAKSYEYTDADGKVVFVVDRYEPLEGPHDKDFAQRRPGPMGWLHNLEGIDVRPMYRLPELLDDLAHERTILLVEGEKDCDTVRALGLAAAAHMGGSSAWRPEYATQLAGADVVILPDNDEPGRAWAAKAAGSLVGAGARVRMLALPMTTAKADVTDWVQAGGTADHLYRLIKKEAVTWAVGDPVPLPSQPPKFTLLSVAELESLPPLEWMVGEDRAGILPAGALLGVFGAPGSGKSFIAADLACTISCTVREKAPTWLGNTIRTGPVVYVIAEGVNGFTLRIPAWRMKHCVDTQTLALHFCKEPVNLSTGEDVSHILRAIDRLHDAPQLVVFDTLARCSVGADENSAQDMGLVIDRAARIVRETGASVLLAHHSKKDDDIERGSIAFRGAVDTLCLCRDDEGEGHVLSCEKQKDADPFLPLTFFLEPVGDSCVVSQHAPVGVRRLTENQVVALRTLADLFGKGATATEWLRGSGIRERTFYRVRAALIRDGYVTESERGNGIRYFIAMRGHGALATALR